MEGIAWIASEGPSEGARRRTGVSLGRHRDHVYGRRTEKALLRVSKDHESLEVGWEG